MSRQADLKSPIANWRLAKPSERLIVNPADSFPFRVAAWLFLILAAIIMISGQRTGSSFFGDLKVFIILAVSQAVLIYLLTKSSNDIFLGTGLKRLKAKVPVEEACPASIRVLQEGSVTGADEGFIWLEEGTLHFKGLQSVWRLNAADLKKYADWPRRHRTRRVPDRIVLEDARRAVWIEISLIDPFEDFHTRRRASRFHTGLANWAQNRPSGSLESVLPPLDLHPGLERTGPLRQEGLISGIILLAVNLVLLVSSRPDFLFQDIVGLESVVQFLIVLALFFFSVRFTFQQLLDGRIRRQLLAPVEKN